MSIDDDAPDDDRDTPRCEHARSQSGEIDVPDLPSRRARTVPIVESSRRPRYRQPDRERDGDNFRDFRETPREIEALGDGIPEPREADVTPSIPHVSPEIDQVVRAVLGVIEKRRRDAANRDLEIASTVQHVSPERSWPTKGIQKFAVHVLALIAGSIVALAEEGYRSARSEMSDQHDRMLVIEQRLTTVEKTLGVIVVPRIVVPVSTGKEPP